MEKRGHDLPTQEQIEKKEELYRIYKHVNEWILNNKKGVNCDTSGFN